LLYSRMWTKAMYDLGLIGFDEPFKKLINQGMIQGSTRFIYFVSALYSYENEAFKNFHFPQFYISKHFFDTYNLDNTKNYVLDKIEEIFSKYDLPSTLGVQISKTPTVVPIRVDVNVVNGNELDTEAFKKLRPEYANAEFIKEDDKYICGSETEKMSKSKYNVVNPDDIVEQYGADTFRMYEMFLGPVEMSKPWDTKGIEGVHRFLKKMWRSYADEQKGWIITDEPATEAELRILHKTLKKISEDIERFAFNTSVSQLMIAVNELSSLNCHKKAILQPLAIAITPFAPHLAEELWQKCLGNTTSIMDATFPAYEEKYVTENSKKYPVSVNGKPRVEIEFPLDMEQSLIEKEVLSNDTIKKWLDGKEPKKIIYVKGKMINVVV
jgi:leucyl-tRNA synthetase